MMLDNLVDGNVSFSQSVRGASSSSSESTLSDSSSDQLITQANNIKVLHININGLKEKKDVLYTEAKYYDIVAVTESKLSNTTETKDILMKDFLEPIRKDRPTGGGGIVLYVKAGIKATRRNELELEGLESIWVDITCKNRKFTLGVIYRTPNATVDKWNTFRCMLDDVEPNLFNKVLIVGDLNDDLLPGTPCHLRNILEDYQLFQYITEATRVTPTTQTLLDPVMSNHRSLVSKSGVIQPFASDHHGTYAVLQFEIERVKAFKKTVWQYSNGDYPGLRSAVQQTDWSVYMQGDDIEESTKEITEKLLSLCKQFIPQKEVTVRPRDPPWLTNSIRKKIRKRNRLHKKAKKSNAIHHWEDFRRCRNEVITEVRETKNSFLKKEADKLRDHKITSKQWWSVVKSLTRSESDNYSISSLKNERGQDVSDTAQKANILNAFFTSQSVLRDNNKVIPEFHPLTDIHLSDLVITSDEVQKVLTHLNPNKAMGPDQINPKVLKECAVELSSPLSTLFNKSLQLGKVPQVWKLAFVTALYKKGDKDLAKNYRPISLLSCVCKVMEKCIFIKLYSHLSDNNLLTPFQSGFIPGDSTVNQLLDIYDIIISALDDGKEVRAVFCDVEKAFDRVWHRGLIKKLHGYGIRGQLLNWFKDYLSNRQQLVLLDGKKSDIMDVKAGVPQGSILGPLLFILYINDIVSSIVSSIRIFADDTSLFLVVEEPQAAAETLNSDLRKIQQWATNWLVTFSGPKTKSMLFSRLRNVRNHPPLFLNQTQIEEVDTHKHLGLTLSSNGTWSAHIDSVIVKGKQSLNVLRKLKRILDRESLYRLYCAYVRPQLEYGCCVWLNLTAEQSNQLEDIQLEAARIMICAPRGTRHELLYKETGLQTLVERRKQQQLVMYYKMKNRLLPPYLSLRARIPPQRPHTYTLRNTGDSQIIQSSSTSYHNSFHPSAVQLWNSLPPDHREAPSVDAFKGRFKANRPKIPKFYFIGNRSAQCIHANLRTQSSSLNYHLYERYLREDPACDCGAPVEDVKHFLTECRLYDTLRHNIFGMQIPNINLLLHGDAKNINLSIYIFTKVHNFIKDSGRFSTQ